MEKIADEMSGLLEQTLGLYQDLKSVLVTEKSYIERMDVKNLWATTDKKKRLVSDIEGVISKMLAQAKQHAIHLDMSVHTFKVREAISALPLRMKVKSQLKALGRQIDDCKKEITLLAYENKRFITEYLTVIDGVFSTLRQGTGLNQYSKSGQIYAPGETTRLINAEV